MEIIGRSENEVDQVIWVDEFDVVTLRALIRRLGATSENEQFFFREAEMDDAYRHADANLRVARRRGAEAAAIAKLAAICEGVFEAHDRVGERRITEAITKLNEVINMMAQPT